MNAYGLNNEAYITRMVNYCKSGGVVIDLENLETIQDKLCWLNIYDVNPLKIKCADKVQLREYCKEIIGEDICIPLIGVYEKTSDIDWDSLPNKFVVKCNHGSGMNIIVKDKEKIDIQRAISMLDNWLTVDFAFQNGFESHYHAIERKILIEEFKENDDGSDLMDFNWWCFNGEPKLVQIFIGMNTHSPIVGYYDMEFNFKPIDRRSDDFIRFKKPESFEKMKQLAKELSSNFKFVRVDFYEVNSKPVLGELTFTPGALYLPNIRKDMAKYMGDMLTL